MITTSPKRRFCAYMRVSTRKQADENTIENQRRAIEYWLNVHTDVEIEKDAWYEETASAFKDRGRFNTMREKIKHHGYDGLIIAKLSRVGRSVKQLIEVVEEMHAASVDLVVVNDNIDTTTPQGRLFFTILAAFNEYEAAIIRERTAEGRQRAKDEGRSLGGPKRKRLEDITDKKPPTGKQLAEYYQNGFGLNRLAKLYGVSRNTMRARLVEIGIVIRKARGVK